MGDDLEGTKDAKGLGRNEVVEADGLVAVAMAGSGSASPGAEGFSARANGSTGVKKALGDAVMSSQISRSFNFRNKRRSARHARGNNPRLTRTAFSQNIGVRDRIWAAENAGFWWENRLAMSRAMTTMT